MRNPSRKLVPWANLKWIIHKYLCSVFGHFYCSAGNQTSVFSFEPYETTNVATVSIMSLFIIWRLKVEFSFLCFSEKVKKTVKAKDSYGLVFDRVKTSNAMKLHNAERGDLNLQHGTIQGILFIVLMFINTNVGFTVLHTRTYCLLCMYNLDKLFLHWWKATYNLNCYVMSEQVPFHWYDQNLRVLKAHYLDISEQVWIGEAVCD
jgi:hypothetical protein